MILTTEIKTEKICTVCEKEKPIDEFGLSASSKDGHLCFCKECNQKRNKNYRLSLKGIVKNIMDSDIDWDKVPVYKHEVRVHNDCVIGDYFKNLNMSENFILQINVWDTDKEGNHIEVGTHRLYVKVEDWKKMLSFPDALKMKSELENMDDTKWSSFIFRYTRSFGTSLPKNLIGLRFKKHGSTGKCVNIGFSINNIEEIKGKFSKK